MEQIVLSSWTDCDVDKDKCFSCAVCNFMTDSTEHLEKHTTAMHHDMPPEFITKIISEPAYTSRPTKQADSLSMMTHVDDTVSVKFPTRERDDIPFYSDSTLKLEYTDDGTEVDSIDLKPTVKDLSDMLSFNTFSSSCVKTEIEHDDKMFSDINQSTIKQETPSPSLSVCEVKDKIMQCQSCSYNNIDFGKLKSHKFTQHPTEAAVIINWFGEANLNVQDIRFFCIKETCSFSTALCNVYEQHLLHCCSMHQTMTRIEIERLKSTITFVLDFHNKLGLVTTSGFLDFVSSFNKNCASLADQDKICDDLEYGSSSSMLSVSNSALLSDVKPSCNVDKRNSEGLVSSVPINTQNTGLSCEVGQTDTRCMCVTKLDTHNGQLMKTDPFITKFPSSREVELINIESSIDHLVSNNVELENDIAEKPLNDNNSSYSEEKNEDNIKDEVNFGTKCKKCGKIFAEDSNLMMHVKVHTGKKPYRCNEYCKSLFESSIHTVHMRTHTGEMPYKCNQCDKGFGEKRYLSLHMRTHKGEKPYRCNECCKFYRHKKNLLQHMRVHTGEKPFRCDECGNGFSQKHRLEYHMRTHTGEKPYKCIECSKGFREKNRLSLHMRVHTGEKPYRCNECGKCFIQKRSLEYHMKRHTGEKPYKCIECGKGFFEKCRLSVHMRTHAAEKPYRCNECCKCFKQKKHLIQHTIVHSGEKPYKCIECGKDFRDKSMVLVHMRTHTGEKPYRCDECCKCFSQKKHLIQHMSVHSGEKPYKCIECGKDFRDKSKVLVHMRTHTREKPFLCNECGKSFSEKRSLKLHMRLHTGEKPFRCTKCCKGFSIKSILTKHMRTHTGEEPHRSYKCNACGKCLSNKSSLSVHMRTHTGEKPYRCNECCKCYRQKKDLLRHTRVHTGEKPYRCTECGKSFTQKHHLDYHTRTHTGEKPYRCNECGKHFGGKSQLTEHRKKNHTGVMNVENVLVKSKILQNTQGYTHEEKNIRVG